MTEVVSSMLKESLDAFFNKDLMLALAVQKKDDEEGTKSTIQKTEDFLNKINQSGLNVSTSGVGIEKKFGDEEKGFNAKVFGNQPFGGQFNYGGQLGFNMKF